MLQLRNRAIGTGSFSKHILVQTRNLLRPAINTSQLTEKRRSGALAMKVGMLPIWDKWGERHAVTVLHMDECEVVQVKKEDTDGYVALQLGVGEAKSSRVKISAQGHFDRANVKPKRRLSEFRVTPDAILPEGTKLSALHFVPGQFVDVCGISKGKGYQGVMKRWNFAGGRASHGNSLAHRIPGSTGCRQDPGRVFKNKKMAGRMGGERTTIQNLKIIKIDPTKDLLYVKGAVPGNNGTFLRVVDSVKGPYYPTPPPVPTYTLKPTDKDFPKEDVFAPVPEADAGKLKEPEDAY